MTGMTQCDQIFLNVGSQVRPKLFMMNFEILTTAASLTSPAIPSQYLEPQFFVCISRQLDARPLLVNAFHEAFPLTCSKNTWRS